MSLSSDQGPLKPAAAAEASGPVHNQEQFPRSSLVSFESTVSRSFFAQRGGEQRLHLVLARTANTTVAPHDFATSANARSSRLWASVRISATSFGENYHNIVDEQILYAHLPLPVIL